MKHTLKFIGKKLEYAQGRHPNQKHAQQLMVIKIIFEFTYSTVAICQQGNNTVLKETVFKINKLNVLEDVSQKIIKLYEENFFVWDETSPEARLSAISKKEVEKILLPMFERDLLVK